MALRTQPTLAPTRKLWAVILAGAVTGALTVALERWLPGADVTEVIAGIDQVIIAAAMIVAGYLTRDSA